MDRVRQLIERLDEELPIVERIAISTELYQRTGERFGSDAAAWRSWWTRRKATPEQPAPTKLVQTEAFAELERLNLIALDQLPNWLKEIADDGRAFATLKSRIASGRSLGVPRRRVEWGSGTAIALRELTGRALILPEEVWRRRVGPIEIHGPTGVTIIRDRFRERALALLASWAASLNDGRRLYLEREDDEIVWLLSEPQAAWMERKSGLALTRFDPTAPERRAARGAGPVDRLVELLGEDRVLTMDGEGFDDAEVYEGVVAGLVGLAGEAIDSLEISASEAGPRRRLRLSWREGVVDAELDGDCDWIDQESVVEVINRMFAARGESGRLIWFDPYESQEVGFAFVPSRLAAAVEGLLLEGPG